ncbi:C-GCAxxG-C-C family protein [Selenihalanaerobacter shriftii]|uniref:C_GCAxxG_C_C family probable redox protein n=1 Tax=Selenihalanaerobacter shriftii TaxID=142842 RepID=A0A1T4QSB3_9FIRM|nr:C-GCAxxG-C-C family protein [Selenihalanaerobacter shriftii]SKA06669.1 C_GCAxxG_C_C family probable redox protein [Selenihalanaerobacter shriftii]
MSNIKEAMDYFKEGFSCSQAVFAAYAPKFGLDQETALKISGPFGGGIGGMGETCGVVTGALMVVGLKDGVIVSDPEEKAKVKAKAQEFINKFKTKNKNITCIKLLGCDISTEEGMEIVKEKELIDKVCSNLVKDAGEVLEEIL